MPYLEIVIVLGLVGVLCWVSFYFYFKKNPEKFRGLSAAAAILVLGPLLPLIQYSLAKKAYGISSRELCGFAVVIVLFVAAIAISLIFGVGVRGR